MLTCNHHFYLMVHEIMRIIAAALFGLTFAVIAMLSGVVLMNGLRNWAEDYLPVNRFSLNLKVSLFFFPVVWMIGLLLAFKWCFGH